jgi:hypothetical protein
MVNIVYLSGDEGPRHEFALSPPRVDGVGLLCAGLRPGLSVAGHRPRLRRDFRPRLPQSSRWLQLFRLRDDNAQGQG